jgi:hypothetical protein
LPEVFIDIPVGHRLRREEVCLRWGALMIGKTAFVGEVYQTYWTTLFAGAAGCNFEGQ